MDSSIQERLQNVIRNTFQDENIIINENTTADDIAMWDSLSHVTLIAEVEEQFGIIFSFNEVIQFNRVGDMVKLIEEKTT